MLLVRMTCAATCHISAYVIMIYVTNKEFAEIENHHKLVFLVGKFSRKYPLENIGKCSRKYSGKLIFSRKYRKNKYFWKISHKKLKIFSRKFSEPLIKNYVEEWKIF